ncbi:hypothetical protein CE967_23050 [Salmonella enterica subsp. enterica serovar Enteritidis]|nr:phage tail tape measure protein [Salmonella enterica subsp. enterica serovar Enteritidis]EDI5471777.1 hypothetical protein [Salmonella enterica subsp. enterica serovar Enteritidis]
MADSFQLKAIITAVDQLSGPLKGMQRELKGFQKEMAGLAIGAAAAGTAVLGALALPVNAAIGFESKMADIRKVVDGLDDKKAFAQMSDDILTLSTQLPMAAEGIAEIVAAGGQAGIARGDLMQFANDAVKMGVAFDTTAEESGQMMAQWRTAFKLTQEDVVVLADKINYLGNTGPANAKKISDIVTRIGPLGGVAGVASGEIAAMGATIAGMGVESEIASTGIKNFMQTKERERGYNGFIPRLKELLGMDTPIPQGRYQPYVPLTRRSGVLERAAPPSTQRSELKVTFENAPQGMRVLDIPKTGNPLMNITHDVGYSPFSNK